MHDTVVRTQSDLSLQTGFQTEGMSDASKQEGAREEKRNKATSAVVIFWCAAVYSAEVCSEICSVASLARVVTRLETHITLCSYHRIVHRAIWSGLLSPFVVMSCVIHQAILVVPFRRKSLPCSGHMLHAPFHL